MTRKSKVRSKMHEWRMCDCREFSINLRCHAQVSKFTRHDCRSTLMTKDIAWKRWHSFVYASFRVSRDEKRWQLYHVLSPCSILSRWSLFLLCCCFCFRSERIETNWMPEMYQHLAFSDWCLEQAHMLNRYFHWTILCANELYSDLPAVLQNWPEAMFAY